MTNSESFKTLDDPGFRAWCENQVCLMSRLAREGADDYVVVLSTELQRVIGEVLRSHIAITGDIAKSAEAHDEFLVWYYAMLEVKAPYWGPRVTVVGGRLALQ